jgi:hypothetical protein
MNRIDWEGIAIYCLVAVVVVVTIGAAMADSQRWEQFKTEHNCRKVSEVAPFTSTGYGFGMTASGKFGSGVVTTTEPGKTAWLCDDGVTYWR